MIVEHTKAIVTDGSGDATVQVGSVIRGTILSIKYAPGTIDTGGDLVITGNTTGVPILTKANAGTADVWYYPRAIPSKVADASAFTDVGVGIQLFDESMKVVVAQGGATKTGAITLYMEEE